jgi:lipopolysaccharide/colanic/teichoic acid biosynthesis glycosyltransferase
VTTRGIRQKVSKFIGYASKVSRALDAARLLALVLLLVYLPALVMIALLLVLSSQGPAFINRVYRRNNGLTVDLWEFRTECWSQWETTRLGAYLRRTNVYRLPSLYNVMRGEIELGERVKPAVDWEL